jgi:ribosomal protein S12 methylthiotransferase accessory factor
MRSSWAQLASGRLYDTPVLLGWQQEIRAEDKMNSLPYFL